MARSQAEFRVTCFVADTLRRCCAPDVKWGHFPAGEYRPPVTGARLKRAGVPRGWPDFIFFHGPFQRVYFLELKAPGGRLSPEQTDFRFFAQAFGFPYAVASDGQRAVEILTAWGVLVGVKVAA